METAFEMSAPAWRTRSRLPLAAFFLLVLPLLAGCPRQGGEGPAERVGKSIDRGAAKVGEGLEKAGEAIQDAAGGS